MGDESSAGLTRRQFIVGGVAGATAIWAGQKFGWPTRAEAMSMVEPTDGLDSFGSLPFADDFDQEFPGGLLTAWNVGRPIQVVGLTPFGLPAPSNDALDSTDFLAGHGLAVAMDGPLGTGTGPGRIETMQTYLFRSGRTYTLSFDVAGSHHRSDPWPASLIASLPGCDAQMTVTLAAGDGYRRYHLAFRTPATAASTVVFESGNAPGQAGLILDNVALVEGNDKRDRNDSNDGSNDNTETGA